MAVAVTIGRRQLVYSCVPQVVVPVSRALQVMTPHLHHIRCITLLAIAQLHAPELAALLRHSMPVLQSFTVEMDVKAERTEATVQALEIAPELFPALQELDLTRIHLLPSRVLRQVSFLNLSFWPLGNPPLALENITAILQELVNIEELKLRLIRCMDDADVPQPVDLPRITLPRLRKLLVVDCPTHVTKHVLALLSLPPSSRITIERHVSEPQNQFDMEGLAEMLLEGNRALIPGDRSGLPILFHATAVDISMLDFMHGITATSPPATETGESGCFKCQLSFPFVPDPEDAPIRLLDDFLDICHAAPVEVVHVVVHADNLPNVDWRAGLAPFPKLRELTIVSYDGEAHHIFAALNPDSAPEGTIKEERVICPRLRKLSIVACKASSNAALLPAVADCLERRQTELQECEGLAELKLYLRDGEAAEEHDWKASFRVALEQLVDNLICEDSHALSALSHLPTIYNSSIHADSVNLYSRTELARASEGESYWTI
ncbi:hypothetical protein OH77DRAFT_1428783 [Trametes cingulata]|nr:hypothetical protein OH77DRAFT_1428783 [Trametes cingulata]